MTHIIFRRVSQKKKSHFFSSGLIFDITTGKIDKLGSFNSQKSVIWHPVQYDTVYTVCDKLETKNKLPIKAKLLYLLKT